MLRPLQPAQAAEPSLSSLIHEADHVLRGKTTAALLDMHIHTKSYDRSYAMVYWGDEQGGHNRTLIKIVGPARWRGHGTLKVDGRLSLYDPSSDRVTVLSSSMVGDNWMGSHFTNDDLVRETELARDYRARELRRWQGEVAGKSATFYRVWLDPTPQAPVAWNHLVLEFYSQSGAVIPTREEYFRRAQQAAPTRVMTFSEVKPMAERDVPTRLRIEVAAQPGEFTELTYKTLRFDAAVPASKFTEQALRR